MTFQKENYKTEYIYSVMCAEARLRYIQNIIQSWWRYGLMYYDLTIFQFVKYLSRAVNLWIGNQNLCSVFIYQRWIWQSRKTAWRSVIMSLIRYQWLLFALLYRFYYNSGPSLLFAVHSLYPLPFKKEAYNQLLWRGISYGNSNQKSYREFWIKKSILYYFLRPTFNTYQEQLIQDQVHLLLKQPNAVEFEHAMEHHHSLSIHPEDAITILVSCSHDQSNYV